MALPKLNSSRYETIVPSTGQTIEYRPYLVKEEKILMIALESSDQQQVMRAVKDVIKACVLEDIDMEKLAIFDIESLFLNLRAKSVGEIVSLNSKCSECETVNPYRINLSDIKPPEVNTNRMVELTDTISVKFNYPKAADLEKFKEGELETVDGAFKLIKSCIDGIYDDDKVYPAKDETDKSLTEFLDGLNNVQFGALTEFFENLPVLKHTIEFNCVKCDKKNEIELRGLQSFFT